MADRILLNANVITMDMARPSGEALVEDGVRICWVGGNDVARGCARAGSEALDLAGQTLVPGFNEAHNHMLTFGLTLAQVDAGYPAVQSIAEIVRAFAARASEIA